MTGRWLWSYSRAALAGVEEELGQLDVGVAAAVAFHVVDKAAKADEGLLHFLVAVEPDFLARAEVGDPAIGQFLGGVIEARVLAAGHGVMVDGGFDEIAGDVAFVFAAGARIPVRHRVAAVAGGAEGEAGLQIAVRFLRGQDNGNPILQRVPHFLLGLEDVRVALGIHHQGQAHGLDRLMHPGVGEGIADVGFGRLAAQFLAGFDEIVDAAFRANSGR